MNEINETTTPTETSNEFKELIHSIQSATMSTDDRLRILNSLINYINYDIKR
jgi:hypothetical protein